MSVKRKLLLAGSTAALVLVVLSAGIHPYLAVTDPVGASVAVVEGWIPEWMMPTVKAEIDKRGYTTIFTTGTERPFSYYLHEGEALMMALEDPVQGEVRINVSGLPQAAFLLMAGTDTLIDLGVASYGQRFSTHMPRPADTLVVRSYNTGAVPDDLYNTYVKYLTVGGRNVHALPGSSWIVRRDSTLDPGTPTFAHASAGFLVKEGVPADRLIIAPAAAGQDSRTLANALGFARHAREMGITKVDVISLGVHARRSRKMFRKACGSEVEVGVIALPDPEVPRATWWRSPKGWVRMMKEVVGVPASSLFDVQE